MFISWWMDQKSVVQPYNGTGPSRKTEQTIDTCDHTGEFHLKGIMPQEGNHTQKTTYSMVPLTGNSLKGKAVGTESRSVKCYQGLWWEEVRPPAAMRVPVLRSPRVFRSSSWQGAQEYLAKAPCSCQKDLKMLQLPVVVWCSIPALSCAGLHDFPSVPMRICPLLCSKQPLDIAREEIVFPT